MIDYHINNLQKGVLQNIKRKTGTVKVMTREQQEVIEKLAYWLNGGFKKDCGILLLGSIGTGKTTIMEVLVAYYHFLHGRIVRKYHAKELPMQINRLGIDYFYKRPVFIDDLGKESATTVI
jgi:predicted AAA+ superfamily ATPase